MTLLFGDALTVLKTMKTNSVDAICCDPPSAINFMNKSWDSNKGGREAWIGWLSAIMAESLRVLKPGGHAFVWALPRTSHWTAIALEDAGYEIRDKNYHLFGQGFPKSLNVGKATEKMTGEKQFDGWGTALKPSVEEWILCRKPLAESSVTRNMLTYGTGAINISGTRINPGQHVRGTGGGSFGGMFGNGGSLTADPAGHNLGRWPSQLLLSHSLFCSDEQCHESCPIKIMDKQSGKTKSTKAGFHGRKDGIPVYGINHVYHKSKTMLAGGMEYGDEGGASRYFQVFDPKLEAPFIYTPKASRKERNIGCEELPEKKSEYRPHDPTENTLQTRLHGSIASPNHHPTVKPIQLMRYLVRMITPPDGVVLDMFAGSGSTLVACIEEGFRFIGIEQEEEYIQIARARIEHALKAKEASTKSPH